MARPYAIIRGNVVANAEWGNKRTCQSCGARFYDLRRTPAECPKCGAKFEPIQILKSRRPKAPPAKAPPAKAPPAKAPPAKAPPAKPPPAKAPPAKAPVVDDEGKKEDEAKKIEPGVHNGAADAEEKLAEKAGAGDANDDDDEEEAVIEDASELGEDEDDVSEVRERAGGAKGPE